MSAKEIGEKLVELCRQGKNLESVDTLYADDVISVEASPPPAGGDRTTKGKAAIRGKNEWWFENHDIHGVDVNGPYPHGNEKFAVHFKFDVTFKPTGDRQQLDEIGVFAVDDGKVVREEFFYDMS